VNLALYRRQGASFSIGKTRFHEAKNLRQNNDVTDFFILKNPTSLHKIQLEIIQLLVSLLKRIKVVFDTA